MDGKTSEWRPGPTVCRCCLTEGCYKDISTEYFWMGKREVYSEMLSETFNVSIAYSQSGGPNSNSRLICEPCISRLRDASEFKRQVQECEKTFMQHLDPGTSIPLEVEAIPEERTDKSVKLERVKLEKQYSDDDFSTHDFAGGDDDDDDDLDDQPLTKFASKVPKKESVDLLDLLDNSQITLKRKSRAKDPPSKKVKVTKKEPVKATASKPVAKPVVKKKKEINPMSIARGNAEIIVMYTTAYPFRLPEESMVCVFCSESFSDPSVFREHMSKEHKKFTLWSAFAHIPTGYYIKVDCTDLRCRLCAKSFESLEDIALHLDTDHFLMQKFNFEYDLGVLPFRLVDNKMSCVFCSLRFPNLRSLSRHTQSHYAKYTCEKCGKSFSSSDPLKKHIQYAHVGNKRICRKCKTVFDNLEARNEHLRRSEKCWQNLCSICGERFMTYTMKKTHLVEVHGRSENNFRCSECPEVFQSNKQRGRHFFTCHTNSFECPCCDRKFQSQRSLNEHKLGHTMEKQYSCTVCSKPFSRKTSLKQHMWVHSDVKRFECKPCNKQFNQKVSWKTHMKSYHPELVDL